MLISVKQWRQLTTNQKQQLIAVAHELNNFTLISNGVKIRTK